ncbi:MAG: alpha/beta fold hydrolase [Planctomycetes bacterium]|nr:alpha/beta fold hydrolase [Planctomycetota bacterium]
MAALDPSSAAPEPLTLQLPGLRVAALAWGPADGLPVLALHGWLDNAASFSALAPRLPGARVVAIDLPGHGLSDHRPPGASYDFLDWVVDVADVAGALGWERFALLGHSMGGAIAALTAGTLPDRVTHAVLLEGLGPSAVTEAEAPDRLARAIAARARPPRAPREQPDRATAVERLRQVVPGLGLEGARALVERGTREVESGVAWRSDPRLRGTSPFRIAEAHVRAFLARVAAPTLLVRARDGYPFDASLLTARAAAVPGLRLLTVDGGHHVHLDAPERVAPAVAAHLRGEPQGEPLDAGAFDAGDSALAAAVRVLVLDVDGVLTTGGLVYDGEGEGPKTFDVRDGLGIKLLQAQGVEVALLSGRSTPAVARRAKDLGIAQVHLGVQDKVAGLRRLLDALGVADEGAVAYMGDDLVDLGPMRRVGLPAAPADAHPEARRAARFVARAPGGRGAVRELCDHLLRARGAWERVVADHVQGGAPPG